MLYLGFIHLALDCTFRDLKFRKISNFVLLVHFFALFKFWNPTLLLLILAPFFQAWIGAGDLKLIAVVSLYARALEIDLHYWLLITALLGLMTAAIFRSKSIPLAPAIIFGAWLSQYLAQEWR